MKFGVHLHPYDGFADLRELCDFVERAEALGYSYVHLPEHLVFDQSLESSVGRQWWDPLLLAAHLAARTSTIRFFFAVLVLPIHHPVRLAKSLATLDNLSGGRLDIGIGLGSLRPEFEALGIPFGERASRTDEAIRVMRSLWGADPSDGLSFHPKPLQQPHPPIFVGGSVRHSVARAAALGDGWLPMGATLDELATGITELRSSLSANGRSADGFPIANKLPAFEPSSRATAHARDSGASAVVTLGGDPVRTREYIERAGAIGVTHLWVELPAAGRLAAAEELAGVLGLGWSASRRRSRATSQLGMAHQRLRGLARQLVWRVG